MTSEEYPEWANKVYFKWLKEEGLIKEYHIKGETVEVELTQPLNWVCVKVSVLLEG